jgi:hypothetical protein
MAEILDTIYSNAYNSGDYYMWEDGNPNKEDRSGFFVTTCVKEGQICIKKCLEQTGLNDDLFGVTVASAAFVGGQEYITGADGTQVGRDHRYSLVVATGVVPVRCTSYVKAGDYVSMNVDGVAKTVDESFGYKVVEIKQVGDVTFATIILSTQGDKLSDIYTRMVDTNQRLQACTENMVVVANVATEASNIAHEVKEELAEMGNKVGNMSGTIEGIQGNINDLQAGSATNESVVQLREEVKASITQVDAKADEVAKEVNGEDGKVNQLIKAVKPLTTWTNGDETGAQYLVDYIKDGVATKTEVDTASSEARNALMAIEKNALGLQSLVSSISIYSVGAFSQANGFSLDDAISVMEVGMVYVPTINHSETYVRDKIITINGQEDASEHIDGGTLEDRASRSVLNASPVSAYDCADYTIDFIRTHSYVWNGLRWDDIPNSVWFIEEYVEYDGQTKFWYTGDTSVTNPKTQVVYAPETLYEWRNDCWVAVATTKHNATAKMINLVRQTADAFSVELVNARGSTASLDVRLNDDEAKIQTLTKWQGETNESIASISQTASENQASIELVVGLKDNERVIKAASIMAAVNEDESNVTIDADKINFYGVAQFNQNGTTTINGSYITTGTIQGSQGSNGSYWDLDAGKLVIKNDGSGTVIDGSCITTGTINADNVKVTNLNASEIKSGTISADCLTTEVIESKIAKLGGWTIGETYIHSTTGDGQFWITSYADSSDYWISASNSTDMLFYVTKNGNLHAKNADIEGKISSTEGKIGGWTISDTVLTYNNEIDGKMDIGDGSVAIYAGNSYMYLGKAGDTGRQAQLFVYNSGGANFGVDFNGIYTNGHQYGVTDTFSFGNGSITVVNGLIVSATSDDGSGGDDGGDNGGDSTHTTHSWDGGIVTTKATCTTEGVKTFRCTGCTATRTETMAKLPHIDANPKDGWCDNCGTYVGGDSGGDEGGDTDTCLHNGGLYVDANGTSCTISGTRYVKCKLCDAIQQTQVWNAPGHYDSDGDGFCDNCDTPMHTHDWSGWTTTKAATCTAEGEQKRTCTCGASETQSIPATGHVMNTKPTPGDGIHWYECQNCDYKTGEVICTPSNSLGECICGNTPA